MSRDKWIEPTKGERTGFGKFKKLPLPYDTFMESEGIPVFRDIGIRDIRELPLKPWKRLGGNGTYIQLYGTEGKWGCYVVEVPPAGALNPEKHIFEKIYMVIEGRGSTEVWLEDDETKKHIFEWGPGSIFSIPINAWHRIVNATNDSALLQAGTTGPVVLNALQDVNAVFNNPYLFKDRFSTAEDFYKENNEVETDPVRGLAMRK
ncbi:MAG: mannose-6-phosphate isomerase-like protein (cupin superfamily), partial [Gammaproteobacteria bacterium]